jgi:RNA polymerase sigma-70 factor (ECF subfamily)
MTESRIDLLALTASTSDDTFVLREAEFRLLYDRTSRALWVYLYRLTRDAHAADDLLQETYYRFLRTPGRYESEQHERNVLYRIATNLVRDSRRRFRPVPVSLEEPAGVALTGATDPVHATGDRTDVQRALAQLRDRDQQLLWLAYAEGSSHQEIAVALGLRTGSVRTLLFRARQRLAALLPRGASRGGTR